MQNKFFYILFMILGLGFSSTFAQETRRKPTPKVINGGVLNGRAISLPMPENTNEARALKTSDTVNVEVTIDEKGNILSALAVSGNPVLRESAEQAAWEAKFSPTIISGKPVRVSGIIVYNYIAENDPSFQLKLSKAEKVRMLGVGMTLYTLNKIGSEPDLESAAFDMAVSIEDLAEILKPLKNLQGLSKIQKVEVTGSVISNIEKNVSGSDMWQLEMGKHLSAITFEMYKYKESGFKGSVDEENLQNKLLKIKEMTFSAPAEIPADFLDGIRKVAASADSPNTPAEEKLVSAALKILQLFGQVIP